MLYVCFEFVMGIIRRERQFVCLHEMIVHIKRGTYYLGHVFRRQRRRRHMLVVVQNVVCHAHIFLGAGVHAQADIRPRQFSATAERARFIMQWYKAQRRRRHRARTRGLGQNAPITDLTL